MVYKLGNPKACFCVDCKLSTMRNASKLNCQMFLDEVTKKPVSCTHARQQEQLCGPGGKSYIKRDEE